MVVARATARWSDVLKHATTVERRYGSLPILRSVRVQANLKLKRFARAEAMIRRGIAAHPDDVGQFWGLVFLAAETGRFGLGVMAVDRLYAHARWRNVDNLVTMVPELRPFIQSQAYRDWAATRRIVGDPR